MSRSVSTSIAALRDENSAISSLGMLTYAELGISPHT
jgi:hypothetical protein